MAPKAPSLYHCPCCGTTFVHRKRQECPACAIPLHLKGEYMVTPCYLYMDDQWFWFESDVMKPWEDGRECAEVDQQLLFQIEDRIPPDLSANSSRYPAPHPERIALEELSKILRDDEAIDAHVVAVLADNE